MPNQTGLKASTLHYLVGGYVASTWLVAIESCGLGMPEDDAVAAPSLPEAGFHNSGTTALSLWYPKADTLPMPLCWPHTAGHSADPCQTWQSCGSL